MMQVFHGSSDVAPLVFSKNGLRVQRIGSQKASRFGKLGHQLRINIVVLLISGIVLFNLRRAYLSRSNVAVNHA